MVKKQKKKIKIADLILTSLSFACGLFIGFYNITQSDSLSSKLIMLLLLSIAIYLQLIIHEGGHLVCGLISGYSFNSFKIGNLMWVKTGDKIKLKHQKIVGMGGQCLMAPPDLVDGTMPFVLYNLGGAIGNLISAIICFGIYFLVGNGSLLGDFLFVNGTIGVLFALLNAVPLKAGMIANDGYNLLCLKKSKTAVYSIWVQLKLSQFLTTGNPLKDIPSHWLYLPEAEHKDNVMTSSLGVFYANILLDKHEFTKVLQVIDILFNENYAITNLHRLLLTCDKIYCNLLLDKPIEDLYTPELKKFMKQMGGFISVIRTQYALELCYNNNPEKAEKTLVAFEKSSRKHPYSGEADSERELVDIIANHYSSKAVG